MTEAEGGKLPKLVSDALLKTRELNFLQEKLMHVESWEEYSKFIEQYKNSLRETIKILEEAIHLDIKNEYPYLHMVTCFIILDHIFSTRTKYARTKYTYLLIGDEDRDLWKSLDSHYAETLKLIEEFFKRIIGLNVWWMKPDFWKDLKIYTDMDRLNVFTLLDFCKRIQPDDPDIWLITANINYDEYFFYKHEGRQNAKDRLEQAEKCLTKTIELDPKRGYAWFLLAEVYFEKKEYDKAIECYMKRLELDEYKIPSIWERVAEVYEAKGDFEKALSCMKKAIELNPIPTFYIGLARIYAKLNCKAEALQAIDEANKILLKRGRKFDVSDLNKLYHIYDDLGEYEKSIEVLGELVTRAKENLSKGTYTELAKQRLNTYCLLTRALILRIIKDSQLKQQRKKLIMSILEKVMEQLD